MRRRDCKLSGEPTSHCCSHGGAFALMISGRDKGTLDAYYLPLAASVCCCVSPPLETSLTAWLLESLHESSTATLSVLFPTLGRRTLIKFCFCRRCDDGLWVSKRVTRALPQMTAYSSGQQCLPKASMRRPRSPPTTRRRTR